LLKVLVECYLQIDLILPIVVCEGIEKLRM